MAESNPNEDLHYAALEEDSGSVISTTNRIGGLSRKFTATASQLIAPLGDNVVANPSYRTAMEDVQKQMRSSTLQNKVRSMVTTTPTDLARSKFSSVEIQHRALSFVPDEMLRSIPEHQNTYSLFQGFQATFPEMTEEGKKHRRRVSRGRKLLEETPSTPEGPEGMSTLNKDRSSMMHELEMLGIRKNMAHTEIIEIDNKIANLTGMRQILVDRLAQLENNETILEHDITEVEIRIDEVQDMMDEEGAEIENTPSKTDDGLAVDDDGFMSQSIYEKLPGSVKSGGSTKSRKSRVHRRKSMPVLHEHFKPGSQIREIKAHSDQIVGLDFDSPFGTMVTSAMDDTVKVWDLNAGRCIGMLEGHTASVRALQVEDNFLATGSADASIKLWDLSKAHYDPHGSQIEEEDEEGMAFENPNDHPVDPPAGSMDDCTLYTLQSHLDEVTALHFRGNVLVSGSSDKTLRQWDLERGRCVQTLDVMWAATQASASAPEGMWRNNISNRAPAMQTDFVGALQVFESALACGTADGFVRLWDLRSGQVHRNLIGHTGPVTCLQFDDVHLVTGSMDRSIRVWDLRTGSIYDAYAYDNPITSMMFDTRRICSAAGEDVVKIYDKVESRQWECGSGETAAEEGRTPSIVEKVRVRDGYLVEGRRDGIVGVWTC
ncbi:WD domain-containing protein [Zalerion maritima]|uniref:Mitochondrial division protein 1 n=1 Tax=Zalerion maritima TaxID=339359 RepID=A0AAD5RXX5_9PEZI|nr:WD domain-containing protein [Zalerion maritima]